MGIIMMLDGIAAKLLADEIKAWLPVLANKLLDRAVEWLPTVEQSRYREQWEADIVDFPGDVSKLLYSLDIIRASIGISLDYEQTTFVNVAKQWLLWKGGFLDLAFVGYIPQCQQDPARPPEYVTIKMALHRITFKQWLHRIRRRPPFRKWVVTASSLEKRHFYLTGELYVDGIIRTGMKTSLKWKLEA